MKIKILFFIALAFPLLMCTSTRPKIRVGGYYFKYKGREYRIRSVTPNFVDGYNILTLEEGDEVLLKGIDKEQDGILDIVTIGDITLQQARDIYDHGIKFGKKRGYIKMESVAREFHTTIGNSNCFLVSYVLALGEIYNKLIIEDMSFGEVIIIDENADGNLDQIKKGPQEMERYQRLYRLVLNNGLRSRDIVKFKGKYIVDIRK